MTRRIVLVLVLLLALPLAASAQIAYASNVQGSDTTSLTITGVTAGSLLVLCGSSGYAISGLSDSSGDSWPGSPAVEVQNGGLLQNTSLWYLKNARSGSHALTITPGFPSFEYYVVAEFTGIEGTLDPKDKSTSAFAGLGNPDSGLTATTSQADELLIGCVGNDGGQNNSTWGNSFTALASGAGNSRALNVAYRIVSATGTYKAASTSAGPQNWQALIATFLAGTAPAPSTAGGRLLLLGVGP